MIKKIKESTRKKAKAVTVAILAAMGIILITISNLRGSDNENFHSGFYGTENVDLYQKALEKRLEETLNSITGADCVNVMITLEGGFEKVYSAANYRASESLFGQSNQNTPPVLKTKSPKIAGVMIVCNNIFDAQSVKEIKKASATCLNISENKIYIIGGTISQ